MKKPQTIALTLLAGVSALLLTACMTMESASLSESRTYPDATYRGGFMDEGSIQVNLEFTLEDGVVTEASFRHLVGADPTYNLDNEEEPYKSVVAQYKEALQYLVGKPLRDHLRDLHDPASIVDLKVDGYTAATIRSNKIISAIRDALNRGPYEY